MDVSASGWSSGCESGWTGYLDESYLYPVRNTNNAAHNHQSYKLNTTCQNDNYEEDLSMVSDASSGPPHFQEVDEECNVRTIANSKKKGCDKLKRSKKASKEQKQLPKHQNQHPYHNNDNINYTNNLDDTASSAAISYSKMYDIPSNDQASVEHFMSFSQNLSATHFQGTSAFSNNHYAFWPSSCPNNADSAEPSHLRGRWE